MADKIVFTKDELHDIYGQVTSPTSSGTHGQVNTASTLGDQTEISEASALGSQRESATGLGLASTKETPASRASGTRNEVTTASDRLPTTGTSTGVAVLPGDEIPAATGLEQRSNTTTSGALRPHNEASTSSELGSRNQIAADSDATPRTEISTGTNVGQSGDTTNIPTTPHNEAASAPEPVKANNASKDSKTAHRTGFLAAIGIGKHNKNATEPKTAPPTDSAASSDFKQGNKATTDAKTAHQSNIFAAASLGTQDSTRRDSDVGPRNETAPEHHHHHHRDKDKTEHEKHDFHHHENKAKEVKAAPVPAGIVNGNTTKETKGIDYGNVSHLGVSTTPDPTNVSRRKSLAESPYRGRIDSTVSPPSPSKKWSFSMADFGLKPPRQESNAVTQQLNKDGSVSMQGGQGRVPRGIGSISSTVRRGSVDKTASERDPAKRWSFTHGDFGLKMPKQQSNAVTQELNRDGSVSAQGGGLGPIPLGGVGEGGRRVSLAGQGARGIGSISSSVRRGSVDATVSAHDKTRKWSLRDADLGLKWPKQPSNLHN